jgi:hypothetical protein
LENLATYFITRQLGITVWTERLHLKVITVTSLFLLSTVTHAETDKTAGNRKNEGLGFGIGALIGGLIAGPPGAVIGDTTSACSYLGCQALTPKYFSCY